MLEQEGIQYDSSIMPARTFYYGMDNTEKYPYKIDPDKKIIEVPLSVTNVLWKSLPALGGFPLRFFPSWYNGMIVKRYHRNGHRAHVYLHPWELDLDQPRMDLNPTWRFVRYYNMKKTESRLVYLLKKFSFGPIGELLSTLK